MPRPKNSVIFAYGKNKNRYRDSKKVTQKEQDWIRRAANEGTYCLEELRKKQSSFGTIVLESDLDMPQEVVYKAYSERWKIELVIRYYKSACEFDETRVHDDYSVTGSKFCDFLSTVLTQRLIKAFDQATLLTKRTCENIMSILRRAKKTCFGDGDWQRIKLNPSQIEVLGNLGLLPKPEQPPKSKPGRPKATKQGRNETQNGRIV